MRTAWTDLPEELREGITAHTGRVRAIEPAATGNHADVASTLHTTDGSVFVKAARKAGERDGPEVRSLRWEAAVNPHAREFAPRLLWQVEAGGWLALGFEYVEGRHADYAPGSPDLEVLAKTIEAFQALSCPDLVNRRVERRWEPVTDDVTPMAGNALLHTDLNPANVLIAADGRAYIVDWAFVSRGAPWVEPAILIKWLIRGGHSPRQAEQWVSRFPSWAEVPSAVLDAFAAAHAELWRRRSSDNPAPWAAELAALTRRWADHRCP
ncbi:phosphotransferase [Thermomonospora umbrina]|uniref:Phosphotransferase family enzyme n=1 Tax=Thermomonospora umbrina TaxID=111806 RepID=A0A3D9SLZ8_9ACTN|nr:phosphotransferase [Thermomonospora umbrina]REE96956.1 phosphotransferase family enzyme [Thermomonospora umbrina]